MNIAHQSFQIRRIAQSGVCVGQASRLSLIFIFDGGRRDACPTLDFARNFVTLCFVSFVAEFKSLPLEPLVKRSQTAGVQAVRESMAKSKLSLSDFAHLISPAAVELLEHMGRRSHAMTQQRFG